MAIGETGVLDGLAQRFLLGLLQRGLRLLVEARGVFPVWAEHAGKEGRRHFIMLGVGRIGAFGNGACGHFTGK